MTGIAVASAVTSKPWCPTERQMITRSPLLLKSFQQKEQGSVAILFGLMSGALFLLAGMAIDYSRITDVHTRLSSAVDAASLAAGRAMLDGKLSDDEILVLAGKFFDENSKNVTKMGNLAKPDIRINRATGSIDINVSTDVVMTVSRIGGFTTMNVPVVSQAVYKQKDIEVGMALDVTGSMGQSPQKGGKSKISSLKSAFAGFAERLIPDNKPASQKVRIGLAPYSNSMNLGTYAATASENKSQDGCVTERKDGLATDAAVGPFLVAADGVDDTDNSDGQTPKGAYYTKPKAKVGCTQSGIKPLTDDRADLIATVNAFNTDGWTAGHLGVQWGWNLISDQWAGVWGGASAPESYDEVKKEKLLKAVVLMTDGSFNTAYHGDWSSKQAIALCNAMKAKGVVVFAVAFDAPADAQATLKTCASSGSEYYANAEDGDDLDAAFNKFAIQLTQLRIAK